MMYGILAVFCVAVTFVGAICGVGGGVILKPLMDAVTGYSSAQINFFCGVTVLAMALTSLLSSRDIRAATRDRRTGFVLAGAAVGGMLGRMLFWTLLAYAQHDGLVRMVQNAILLLLLLGTLLYELNRKRIVQRRLHSGAASAGISVALGTVSTFLGIGGGPFNLIVLKYFFSMDTKEAAAHSLLIILLSQGVSLAETLLSGAPDMPPLLLFLGALSGVVGGSLGRRTERRMQNRQVERLFMALLVLIVLICISNMVRFAL